MFRLARSLHLGLLRASGRVFHYLIAPTKKRGATIGLPVQREGTPAATAKRDGNTGESYLSRRLIGSKMA